MASTIKLKNSTTAGNAPSSLETGEVAINVADGNLFYGSESAVLQNFVVNELEVKGNLTAQQYIVSSSVTYTTQSFSSGSTAFGDSADDTHVFTGNVTASGNISASGTVTANSLVGSHTLTTAAQPNVTSLGTLTSLTVDTLNLDTNAISSTSDEDVNIGLGVNGISFEANEGDKFIFNSDQENIDFEYSSTGDLILVKFDASEDRVGIGNATPTAKLDVSGSINTTSHITASGNISASGTIVGSNLSGTNTGDQDISKFVENAHTAMPLFTFVTSTNAALTPSSGEFLQVDAAFDFVAFNSQSLDGVDLAPQGISHLLYDSPGTVFTIIETGSGAYKTYRTNTVLAQTGDYISFGVNSLTQDTHSSGSINNGDIVYLRVDQSTPTIDFQSPGAVDLLLAPALDSTFNFIETRFTDTNIGVTGLQTSFDTTNTDIKILPVISKSAALTLGELTVNGNITVTGTVDGTDVAQLKTDFDTLEGKTLVSSSAQIASDISGSFTAASGGFSTRVSTLEGAGYVDTSGTPADNQISVFTDADTIEGSSKLVFVNDNSTGFSVRATNSDAAAVTILAGVLGSANPKFGPSGSHSSLKMGLSTSGDVFDFQNNKIAFDQDSTNTFIQADTDNPENLEIHADGNIELRADDNLEIHGPISTAITASAGISASRIDASIGNLIFDDVPSVTTTTPKGEIIKYGTATSAVTAGSIYRLNADGNWFTADADFEISSSGLLGVAVSSNAADGFLIRGICDLIVASTTPTGSTLYLSTTDGRATHTPTSGSGDVIRVVGYNLNGGSQAYFNPDGTYIVAS